MHPKLLLILLLILLWSPLHAQQSDTTFWSDPNDAAVHGAFSKIVFTSNDTVREVTYWKRKPHSIKHTTSIHGCPTPILTDTVYSDDRAFVAIQQHKIIHLSDSMSCDSLLRILTSKIYKNGTLQEEGQHKYVGLFGKCPCGQWKQYLQDTVHTKQLISCEDNILDNLTLTGTRWRPDSTYYVEIYQEKLLRAVPGQGGDHTATIVLKRKTGEVIKVVSSASRYESEMHRSINIVWSPEKNWVNYSVTKILEWVDEDNVDLEKIRSKINGFMGNSKWDYYGLPVQFGDRYYAIGEFYGEPEYDRTLDFATLIVDSAGEVKLLIIDNYNYDGQENFAFVDITEYYAEIGRFQAIRVGTPLWANWVEGIGLDGYRAFEDVPQNERVYLTHDALYVHAGDACGGGFIYWKDDKWNWLQQE